MGKKEQRQLITFRILPSVIELIKEQAKKENRSQGNYLETLVMTKTEKK